MILSVIAGENASFSGLDVFFKYTLITARKEEDYAESGEICADLVEGAGSL